MNLETWFSGKCGPEIDTLSGEGVGFSDIITLQGIEVLIGPQQKGLIDQMIELFNTLGDIRTIIGSNNGQTLDQKLAQVKSITPGNSGLLGQAANLTSTLLLAKPAATSDYIAYISGNLKNHQIIDQAYAATPGYGFTALSPILPLWRAFRNVAYLLFALAFVLYGVMIMLRVKIDSKTAATIELAIPKLIATLLIITFSYAIVGLLVDISTVITGLAVNVLAVGGILNMDWFTGSTIIPIAGGTSWLGGFGSFFVNTIVALMVAPFILISFLFAPYAGLTGSVVFMLGATMGWGFIIGIIIFIAILISYVKLIMKLFSAFLSIVVSLIFAPIILLGNVFPGSSAFSTWLLSIYGNLAVFPTAVFFLTLSYALMVQPFFKTIRGLATASLVPGFSTWINGAGFAELIGVEDLTTTGGMWTPPMTLAFGIQGDIMLAAIGFGLLLMSSKYVDMVRDALKVPPFKYGSAIGDALKTGVNLNESWAKNRYRGPYKTELPTSKFLRDRARPEIKRGMDAAQKNIS